MHGPTFPAVLPMPGCVDAALLRAGFGDQARLACSLIGLFVGGGDAAAAQYEVASSWMPPSQALPCS